MLLGIDISHYQTNVNYGAYDFIIMKASEGVGYKDPMLDDHYNNIHGSTDGRPDPNKLYGFYHYARPETGNTAEAEADYFLSLVGHHAGNAIFALDWEGNSLACSTSWALAWMRRVYQKTGVRPVIYLSASELNSGKYADIAAENYGLWVAHWKAQNPKVTSFYTWALWQYEGDPLDKNYFNGDSNTWNAYAGRGFVEVPIIPEDIKVGSKVRVITRIDYNGIRNAEWVLGKTFEVMSIKGDRVVIGQNGQLTGVWHKIDLEVV